jgi:hypothetical protein
MAALCVTPFVMAAAETSRSPEVDRLQNEVVRLRSALAAAEEELAAMKQAKTPITESKAVIEASASKLNIPETLKQEFPVWGYSVRLPVLVGYDDNPTGLSNEVPRRRGLSHRDSAFIELNPSLKFVRTEADKSKWTFEYNLDKYFYQQQADINLLVNEFKLTHERNLSDADTLSVTAGDQIRRTDEEGKANQFLTNVGLKHAWDERSATTLEYSFSWTDFALPDNAKIPTVLDPDNKTNGIAISQSYVLRETAGEGGKAFALTGGYAFLTTNAEGADQDVNRHRLSITLAGSPFSPTANDDDRLQKQLHKLQMQAKYVHDFDDYRHDTSTAGRGFEFKRSANSDRFFMTLTYPIERNLNWEQETSDTHRRRGPVQALWTITYSYSRSDSNIFGEDKDNHVIKAGIIADF